MVPSGFLHHIFPLSTRGSAMQLTGHFIFCNISNGAPSAQHPMGLARLEFRVEDPDALEQLRHKSLPAYEIQPGEGLDTLCQCFCEYS